ncbi:MAG: hypothetical protein WCF26_23950 [Candidatus Sulfotelmatobacter sp.]
MIFDFFRNTTGAVREINQKYAKPHIEMTRMVRFSLGALRFYLLLLVGIMIYKFITLLH